MLGTAAAQDGLTPASRRNMDKISRDLHEEVSRMRGLSFRQAVEFEVLPLAGVRQRLLKSFLSDVERKTERFEAMVLRKLGLLKDGAGLPSLRTILLDARSAGFYEPATGRLVVGKYVPGDEEGRRVFLALLRRELLRALIDQHHDLQGLYASARCRDHLVALQALVDGDIAYAVCASRFKLDLKATGEREKTIRSQIMRLPSNPTQFQFMNDVVRKAGGGEMVGGADFVTPGFGKRQYERLFALPDVVGRDFVFRNFTGLKFCDAIYRFVRPRSWSSLDRIYSRPPMSTENILDAQTYFGPSGWPVALTLPSLETALGEGYKFEGGGEFGALRLLALLEHHKVKGGDQAVRGWRGDAHVVLSHQESPEVLAWITSWDTAKDALEFAAAVRDLLTARYSTYDLTNVTGRMLKTTDSRGFSTLMLVDVPKGSPGRVVVVEEAPSGVIGKVAGRIMEQTRERTLKPQDRKR